MKVRFCAMHPCVSKRPKLTKCSQENLKIIGVRHGHLGGMSGCAHGIVWFFRQCRSRIWFVTSGGSPQSQKLGVSERVLL